jgi:hypothetical protein
MIPKSGTRFLEKDHAQVLSWRANPQISLRNLRKLDCFPAKPVPTFARRAPRVTTGIRAAKLAPAETSDASD